MPVTDVLPRSGLPRTGTRFKKIESYKVITDDLFPPFKMEKHNDLDEISCQHSQNVTEQSTEFKRENSELLNQMPGKMTTSNAYDRSKKALKIKLQLKLLKQIGKKKSKFLQKVLTLKKAGMDF